VQGEHIGSPLQTLSFYHMDGFLDVASCVPTINRATEGRNTILGVQKPLHDSPDAINCVPTNVVYPFEKKCYHDTRRDAIYCVRTNVVSISPVL